ncbi:hypothetical protein AB5I41_14960 [Sphingomonas sp. MMS24-JH45]
MASGMMHQNEFNRTNLTQRSAGLADIAHVIGDLGAEIDRRQGHLDDHAAHDDGHLRAGEDLSS